jgi:beta-galactosidase
MRSVGRGRPFWLNEVYTDIGAYDEGTFSDEQDARHIRHGILAPIAHGAKGALFWQYKTERVGVESNGRGLVTVDGHDTSRSLEAARIGKFLAEHGTLFTGGSVPPATIAILYDIRSDLFSALEDHAGNASAGKPDPGYAGYAYKRALRGAYAMFYRAGFAVEWVDARRAEDLSPERFRLAYLPMPFMTGKPLAERILGFVRGGGILVAEAGFGLRAENTWLQGPAPGSGLAQALGYVIDRHFRLDTTWMGVTLPTLENLTLEAVARFDRLVGRGAGRAGEWTAGGSKHLPPSSPAAVECRAGNGKAIVFGFSPGLSFSLDPARGRGLVDLAAVLARAAGVAPTAEMSGNGAAEVVARALQSADGKRILGLSR